MKLIADAGSTKIHWVIVDADRGCIHRFHTKGLNPALTAPENLYSEMEMRLDENLKVAHHIDEIHYYGAGCTPAVIPEVARALTMVTGCSRVQVASDLLGAARALFPSGRGIACILGTGSNSCLIDSGTIIDNVPPLGYILGDEGSGASLGRRLFNYMLKRRFPASILEQWTAETGIDYAGVIEYVYRGEKPNVFLAHQTHFIADNLHVPEIYEMVTEEMCAFIRRNILVYPDARHEKVRFTGSVAQVFEAAIRDAAKRCGIIVDTVNADPTQGLINYHLTH